jgi:hypothetical protein
MWLSIFQTVTSALSFLASLLGKDMGSNSSSREATLSDSQFYLRSTVEQINSTLLHLRSDQTDGRPKYVVTLKSNIYSELLIFQKLDIFPMKS